MSSAEYTQFDLAAFGDLDVKQLFELAHNAENAERYEDMCAFMAKLTESAEYNLNNDQRNLLSVAFKNVVGARRASWRTFDPDDTKVAAYKEVVEAELKSICETILGILDKLSEKVDAEANAGQKIFYDKMRGDYNRYLAEVFSENKDYGSVASERYASAYKLASTSLKSTDPIRLGLALNYSVCQFEILKDKSKACELAKSAFDDAIAKLDTLDEASYKDSTLIMQLLRDNLNLWTADQQDEEEE